MDAKFGPLSNRKYGRHYLLRPNSYKFDVKLPSSHMEFLNYSGVALYFRNQHRVLFTNGHMLVNTIDCPMAGSHQ